MELFEITNRFLFISPVEPGTLEVWDVEEKTRERTQRKIRILMIRI
jgi:hypothetical protein